MRTTEVPTGDQREFPSSKISQDTASPLEVAKLEARDNHGLGDIAFTPSSERGISNAVEPKESIEDSITRA